MLKHSKIIFLRCQMHKINNNNNKNHHLMFKKFKLQQSNNHNKNKRKMQVNYSKIKDNLMRRIMIQ